MAEYIEREALIVRWKAAMLHMVKSKDGQHPVSIETLIEDLELFPAADVAPVRHGQWIHDINNLYGCSVCMERETMSPKKLKPYCPNCGAKMDGGENNG